MSIPTPLLTATQNRALQRGDLVVLLHLQTLLDPTEYRHLKQGALGRQVGMTQGYMSRCLRRLRAHGYVDARLDGDGSRTYRLVAA